MECPLDTGAVVLAEIADLVHDQLQVGDCDLMLAQDHFAVDEARLGQSPQVHHNLDQFAFAIGVFQHLTDAFGQHRQQQVEVIGDLKCSHR